MFKPVHIEELRGLEFLQLTQVSQSVEQLGIELEKLAIRVFPCLEGRDLDRLLKGCFFQAFLPKCQRKLGAPKAEEVLMNSRMTECCDKQYAEVAGGMRGQSEREALNPRRR